MPSAGEWAQIASAAMAAAAAVAAWRAASASRASVQTERRQQELSVLFAVHETLQSMTGGWVGGSRAYVAYVDGLARARRDLRALLRTASWDLVKCWELADWDSNEELAVPDGEMVTDALREVEGAIAQASSGRSQAARRRETTGNDG